jgi:hypothetical protein
MNSSRKNTRVVIDRRSSLFLPAKRREYPRMKCISRWNSKPCIDRSCCVRSWIVRLAGQALPFYFLCSGIRGYSRHSRAEKRARERRVVIDRRSSLFFAREEARMSANEVHQPLEQQAVY